MHQAAATDSRHEILKLFLSIDGIDVDYFLSDKGSGNYKFTPLHQATWELAKKNVKILLLHGASTTATTGDGETAKQIAERQKADEKLLYALDTAEKVV